MSTRYFVEFVDNNNDEDYFIQSPYFKNEKRAKKWIVKIGDINFDKVLVFIHTVNFKKNSRVGEFVSSKKFTENDYFKIQGE